MTCVLWQPEGTPGVEHLVHRPYPGCQDDAQDCPDATHGGEDVKGDPEALRAYAGAARVGWRKRLLLRDLVVIYVRR